MSYSFENVELPNHFDIYFSEIASVHTYQTRPTYLQKYHVSRMKMSLDHLSLKYVGPKISSDIPENLKSPSIYQLGKNILTFWYLTKIPVDFRFMCVSLVCNIVLMSHFPLPRISFTFCSFSPHPPARSHVFLHCFCRCFVYFIWHWFDAFYFFSFITCETCLIKNWFVLTQGWLRAWPIWSFSTLCDSNMLEHNRQFAQHWVSYVFIFSSTWN